MDCRGFLSFGAAKILRNMEVLNNVESHMTQINLCCRNVRFLKNKQDFPLLWNIVHFNDRGIISIANFKFVAAWAKVT